MIPRFLPLVLLLLVAPAIAQPGGGGSGGGAAGATGARGPERGDRALDRPLDRQQLRGDLRAARGSRLQDAEAGVEEVVPARHLSPRERAEMRELLRRESLQRARTP